MFVCVGVAVECFVCMSQSGSGLSVMCHDMSLVLIGIEISNGDSRFLWGRYICMVPACSMAILTSDDMTPVAYIYHIGY